MNHCGTVRLETPRLILRRFRTDDAEAMFRNWAGDPEVTKYLAWPTHQSAEVSARVLADWVASYPNEAFYQWAIVPKESGDEPIGSIAAVKIDDSLASVEVGYCIGRRFWRQGITSEALGAVIDFFFDSVGANRIEARHDPNNPHSGGVMKKCGMKYEGTLRAADRNNQGICDAARYSVLRSDR